MGFDPRTVLQTREIWSKQLEQGSQVVPPAAGPLINVPWYVAAPVTLIRVEFAEIIFTEPLLFSLRYIYPKSTLHISPISLCSKFILIAKRYSKSLIEHLAVYRDLFLGLKGIFRVCDWSGVEGSWGRSPRENVDLIDL